MNCPSRTEPELPDGWNQSPNALSADLTTRSDLSRIANARLQRDHRLSHSRQDVIELEDVKRLEDNDGGGKQPQAREMGDEDKHGTGGDMLADTLGSGAHRYRPSESRTASHRQHAWLRLLLRLRTILVRFAKFIGPGFMVSVAYIDPGNYATDLSAGALFRFKLLFIVLMSNLFAIYLQSLCIKLGTVTGMNLAEMIHAHFPPWLNYLLYFFAECAIIATDIAEVIGTAIALNLLSKGRIPLVAGCAISIVDVLFILLFYRPDEGSMRALRLFEFFVVSLVIGVTVCFGIQLSLIRDTSIGEVFKGYLPSQTIFQGQGLYQACGILGATVMPHSLYLGSGIIQARLKDFDRQQNPTHQSGPPVSRRSSNADDPIDDASDVPADKYRPSLSAIRGCMSYSIAELALSLFTFALFVNSAILIVAGSSLSTITGADSADLFGIHRLLSTSLAPAAGTIFALALLLSGISAGIVCTIAGQMVSEGQLNLSLSAWVRRLITRSISITPSIIIAGAVGGKGLSAALNGTQVALSVILPVVSAPLIYFTCRERYMTVGGERGVPENAGAGHAQETAVVAPDRLERGRPEDAAQAYGVTKMANSWITTFFAVVIWVVIVIMNVALLVMLGLGRD